MPKYRRDPLFARLRQIDALSVVPTERDLATLVHQSLTDTSILPLGENDGDVSCGRWLMLSENALGDITAPGMAGRWCPEAAKRGQLIGIVGRNVGAGGDLDDRIIDPDTPPERLKLSQIDRRTTQAHKRGVKRNADPLSCLAMAWIRSRPEALNNDDVGVWTVEGCLRHYSEIARFTDRAAFSLEEFEKRIKDPHVALMVKTENGLRLSTLNKTPNPLLKHGPIYGPSIEGERVPLDDLMLGDDQLIDALRWRCKETSPEERGEEPNETAPGGSVFEALGNAMKLIAVSHALDWHTDIALPIGAALMYERPTHHVTRWLGSIERRYHNALGLAAAMTLWHKPIDPVKGSKIKAIPIPCAIIDLGVKGHKIGPPSYVKEARKNTEGAPQLRVSGVISRRMPHAGQYALPALIAAAESGINAGQFESTGANKGVPKLMVTGGIEIDMLTFHRLAGRPIPTTDRSKGNVLRMMNRYTDQLIEYQRKRTQADTVHFERVGTARHPKVKITADGDYIGACRGGVEGIARRSKRVGLRDFIDG